MEFKRGKASEEMPRYRAALGRYAPRVAAELEQAAKDEVARRIWDRDVTLWPGVTQPANLGWLDAPKGMNAASAPLKTFADEVRAGGFGRALLLGVGAPYLALELISTTFGSAEGYLQLDALASTDADAVMARARDLDPATLIIVADKSGGATETHALFKFFYNRVVAELGTGAGDRFVAICNPGDPLAALTEQHRFRAAFLNDANVPGCYAALSLCGLLPAALAGVDLPKLRTYALAGAAACAADLTTNNAGVWLGAVLGTLAKAGRDKVTFVLPDALAGLGAWLERLLAEATGKAGVGLVPVLGEPLGTPELYGGDRVFVHLQLGDDTSFEPPLAVLEAAGQPVMHVALPDGYSVAEQLFVWQFGAAVAAYHLGVNPFVQPDVATANARTRELMAHYDAVHSLPDGASAVSAEALLGFLAKAKPGDYIALQAYLPPSVEVSAELGRLRAALRERFGCAVTCAFGPNYLHSTGQLQKGGKRNGHIVQLVSEPLRNALIPGGAGAPVSFYVLKKAQALGDKRALEAAGQRVIQFNLGQRVVAGLEALSQLQ